MKIMKKIICPQELQNLNHFTGRLVYIIKSNNMN